MSKPAELCDACWMYPEDVCARCGRPAPPEDPMIEKPTTQTGATRCPYLGLPCLACTCGEQACEPKRCAGFCGEWLTPENTSALNDCICKRCMGLDEDKGGKP